MVYPHSMDRPLADPALDTLAQTQPELARRFSAGWDTPAARWAAAQWAPPESPRFEPALRRALAAQLAVSAGPGSEALLDSIEANGVVLTPHHVCPTPGPTFGAIDVLSALGHPGPILVLAWSGVPISNSAVSGALCYAVAQPGDLLQEGSAALARHHLTAAEVVGQLRRLLGIETPWHMTVDGRDRRLQLTYADADRLQFDRIAAHTFRTRAGDTVRLGDLVSLERRPVVTTITRRDQRYSMQINWEYIGTDRMRRRFLKKVLDGLHLPYGYSAEDVSGERFSREEEQELGRLLWLTALFILMTLAALFESLSLPWLVALAVPMALSGVMAVFWLADATFDSSARIGLVLLFGVVVNNAILLVSRFRLQLRELVAAHASARRLLPPRPRLGARDLWPLPDSTRRDLLARAVAGGTRIQLRSILLTSGTTIAGMLPLLVRTHAAEGKDIWENLALSSVGGLASSTVLIVVCLPALYWLGARAGWAVAERWHRLRRRRGAVPVVPPLDRRPAVS